MIKTILGIWLSLGLCSISFAQSSFEIKGSIVDAGTLKAIAGASIIGENTFAVSTSDGEFIIKNMPQGTHTFKVSHIGYVPEVFTAFVGGEMKMVVVKLQALTTTLEEVEIVGKSKDREAKELPRVSYRVSKEFLEKNRENSLMQTLKKIPGVSAINIGSGQSKPVIRGLGFNRVVVVQNGIKHEAQQWGNDHGLEIDQYGTENIEIIKGPASMLYGSDAIAGVVDIQAPAVPLPDTFGGEVNLLAESNNDLGGVSVGIQGRKEKWFYRGRLTLRDYADYKVPTEKIRYENYIFHLQDNYLRNTAGSEANASLSIGYISDHVRSETFVSNVYARNGFFANAHGLEVRTSKIDYDISNRDIDLPFHKVNHFKVTNNTSIFNGQHTFYFDFGYQRNKREEHSEPVPHGYMPKPANSKERQFNKSTYSINARDAFDSDSDYS